MSWNCPNCGESIEPALNVCWQCGTARDGTPDPTFEHADNYEPPMVEAKPQFRLGTMLKLTAAACLVFAMFRTMMSPSWNPFVIMLGLGGFMFLALYFVTWALVTRTSRLQREVRQSVRQSVASQRTFEE